MSDQLGQQDSSNSDKQGLNWQLNALTEALGNLTLTVIDSLSIGRGTDNDVVLGSKEVSRNHALLSVLNGELYVKDLASSNGTFINDERIESNQSTSVQVNDTLGFASFSFKVTTPAAGMVSESNLLTGSDGVNEADLVTESNVVTEADAVSEDDLFNEVDVVSEAYVDADASISRDIVTENDFDAGINTVTDVNTVTEVNSVETVSSNDTYNDIEKLSAGTASTAITDTITTPVIEPATVEPSVVEETVLENYALANQTAEPVANLEQNPDALPITEPVSAEEVSEHSLVQQPIVELPLVTPSTEPVVKSTMIAEVLASAAMPSVVTEQEKVLADEIPKQPLAVALPVKEPVVSEPIISETMTSESVNSAAVSDEPLIHEQDAYQQPVVSPEHDKTTTTALQEEADPDVLRAKQAATGQFSGTANLGQGRDLGTQGNNAMDQALDNSANAAYSDKKPSGSWFIWVFIAIIIVGLALWLFNMGGA